MFDDAPVRLTCVFTKAAFGLVLGVEPSASVVPLSPTETLYAEVSTADRTATIDIAKGRYDGVVTVATDRSFHVRFHTETGEMSVLSVAISLALPNPAVLSEHEPAGPSWATSQKYGSCKV
ncbi:MAG: hypothetical protein AAFR28_18130 [Pseudomonadota bacterium]